MIDLHTHTTASDGQHCPSELVALANKAQVSILAVTDHDTVDGLSEAELAAKKLGISLIHGIELSTFVGEREAHLLGHFIDNHPPKLRQLLDRLRDERERRMVAMIARLQGLGVHCSLDEVLKISGGRNFGRPHLARVLVENGSVSTVKEAFDRFIGIGKPAYVERYKIGARDAIALIGQSGGAATVAHAFASRLTLQNLLELRNQGLAGLEVNHPDHDHAARTALRAIAQELDLVPTGGSDFHGDAVAPGRGIGSMEMDSADLARLRERAGKKGASNG